MDLNTISRNRALRIISHASDTPQYHEMLKTLSLHSSPAVVRRAVHKLTIQFPLLRGELPKPMEVHTAPTIVPADDVLPEVKAVKTEGGAYVAVKVDAAEALKAKRSAAAKKAAATRAAKTKKTTAKKK